MFVCVQIKLNLLLRKVLHVDDEETLVALGERSSSDFSPGLREHRIEITTAQTHPHVIQRGRV